MGAFQKKWEGMYPPPPQDLRLWPCAFDCSEDYRAYSLVSYIRKPLERAGEIESTPRDTGTAALMV